MKKNQKINTEIKFRENHISSLDWDTKLAELKGHPLQSALWGDAKMRAGGSPDLRLMCSYGGKTLCMARIEEKIIPGIGRAAWIPKGPVFAPEEANQLLHTALQSELRRRGFIAVLMTPYNASDVAEGWRYKTPPYQTIINDLDKSSESIFESFPTKLRAQIRSVQRKGVVVEMSRDKTWINHFYKLCTQVSATKGFELPGSFELMSELLLGNDNDSNNPVNAEFMLAKQDEKLLSGYIFIRVGNSLHNIWSAYNRDAGVSGASDLVVWEAIKSNLERGCIRYDQEGIDKEKNLTTYLFKKKFGGSEVEIPGMHVYPLGVRGEVAVAMGRLLGKL